MPDDVGDDLRQNTGVEDHYRAGDGRHPAGHHRKQLTARHPAQVGSDEKRRFHHSQKDIGRHAQALGTAQTQCLFQHPREAIHHQGEHFPVEEQRRKGTDQEQQGERPKGENEAVGGDLFFERSRAAAQIAEHESRSRLDRFFQGQDHPVETQKDLTRAGDLQKEDSKGQLQGQAEAQQAERHPTSMLAHDPGQPQEDSQADGALQVHCRSQWKQAFYGSSAWRVKRAAIVERTRQK